MAKQDKQDKLPKKIAGVKVPKELRKAGEAAKKLAQEPIVGELVSAALLAAAASLAETKKGRQVRREAFDAASETATETVKEASAIGQSVKKVLIDAARDLLDRFESAPASPRRSAAEPTPEAPPEPPQPPKAKKSGGKKSGGGKRKI